jgi:hypothetical protein
MSEKGTVFEDGSTARKAFPQEGSCMGMTQLTREMRYFKIFHCPYLSKHTHRGFG